ncbi:MAG: ATP-dependent helicase [Verrucomicrobia bacterium]|nr:MAG: ATP-dependent helicase [Verrucomicrobiota bacterium]
MIALKDSLGSKFVERIRAIFSENGLLSKAANFEFRPQQQEMAAAVARALEEDRHLVVEAGTGVGKSLAYLAPAILFALEHHKKAIVSTHTINLQEQLLYKDIPILKKVLPVEFEASLMKGRQNYLCPRRLERALQQANEVFTGPEQSELTRLAEWASTTRDGSLSDLSIEPDPKVWTQVCSEPHICTQKTCGQNVLCFYQQARKRLLAADLLVMNHTLLFMLLGKPDEQEERESGYLFPNDFIIFDEAHTVEGLFTVMRDANGVRLAAELIDEVDRFFAVVEAKSDFRKGREFRVHVPDFVPDTITGRLSALQARLADVIKRADDEFLKAELQELGRRIRDTRDGIAIFLEQSAREHVYWIERTGKTTQFFSLNAAPINVAPVLRRMIFRENCCSVMTSATLSVGRPDLAYFRTRIGGDNAEPLQLGSPFDFRAQMKIYIVKKMPDPRDGGYQQQLAAQMQKFFVEKEMNLLVQGGGAPRGKLLDQFRSTPCSVLFGTDSFWSGVDVPGEALSNVIITRLPFAVPDHPLIEAKLELVQERGGDAFTEYSLPEAILKLRQGVGRLIRTKSDRGIVVILDNRIVTKPYGRSFLAALPKCPVEII